MARPFPLQPGSYYHVYNRGNNGEDLFLNDRHRAHFMRLYAKYVEPVAETFAFCLLRNHFHLLVRIKDEDLTGLKDLSGVSRHFANLFNAYARAFNREQGRSGALFQRPFGRIEVSREVYLLQLVLYIHQNPQRHGLVPDFRGWPHSSYPALIGTQRTRLKRAAVLAWFGGRAGFEAAHGRPADERRLSRWLPKEETFDT